MTFVSSLDSVETAPLQESDLENKRTGSIGFSGFSVMCAWHFLVLFTSLPLEAYDFQQGRPFVAQLTLFVSMAVAYFALTHLSRFFATKLYTKRSSWIRFNVISGVVATASTAMTIFTATAPLELVLVNMVLLGISQSLLMFPWLQLPRMEKERSSYRSMSLNMGIGAVIAFVIGNLQIPFFYVAFCLLPAISNVLNVLQRNKGEDELVASLKTAKKPEEGDNDVSGEEALASVEPRKPRLSFRDSVRINAHFIVLGIIFGICQVALSGVQTFAGEIYFAANSVWPIIGMILSAIILVLIPMKFFRLQGVFSVQRIGILLFILGTMMQLYFIIYGDGMDMMVKGYGILVAQCLFLAGFNVFDFGFMTSSYMWASRLSIDFSAYIGFNRAITYASIAVGLAVGFAAAQLLLNVPGWQLLIAALALVVLSTSTLPFFDNLAPYAKVVNAEVEEKLDKMRTELEQAEEREQELMAELSEQQESEGENAAAHWNDRVSRLADAYGLSKREREILFYLAKGRNASYIQQELWISIHTVKTHIANIYHKLDVHSAQEVIDMIEADTGAKAVTDAQDAAASAGKKGKAAR